MNISHRVGRFFVPLVVIDCEHEWLITVFGKLKFIPIRAEARHDIGAIDYIGYSHLFLEKELYVETPYYDITVTHTVDDIFVSIAVTAENATGRLSYNLTNPKTGKTVSLNNLSLSY